MSFRKLRTLMLIAGGIIALGSCKKEEETPVTPSLNGVLSIQAELWDNPDLKVGAYVAPETKVKLIPKGLKHPDGGKIGYYWKVTPDMAKVDTSRYETGLSPEGTETDGSHEYTFRDSLATYTISFTGFSKGYSSSYASKYVTVVKPGLDGSLTGTGIVAIDPHESYDGVDYYYVNHNGLDWMRNNLAVSGSGAPYSNAEVMSNVLGRYYSYEEAKAACTRMGEWRLPTGEEWDNLAESISDEGITVAAALMANVQFNLQAMWEYWPEVGDIRDSGRMAVIPAGYANLGAKGEDGSYPMASFRGIYEYAAFWTADPVENEEGMAYYRYLICDQPDMYVGKGDINTFGASVRCVRAN